MEPEGGKRSEEAIWRVLISPPAFCQGVLFAGQNRGGTNAMPDQPRTTSAERTLAAAKIVGAYLRRNPAPADGIAALISTVHQALANVGKPATEPAGERIPAVPIRRSIHRDYVVCLDCGWRGQMLRRHVTTAHKLTVEDYRTRWNLPADHAITARGYSERRATMAKQIGLGRVNRRTPGGASEPENPRAPQPQRRGRPRSTAAPA
jgi:predicted transcriptional regulator